MKKGMGRITNIADYRGAAYKLSQQVFVDLTANDLRILIQALAGMEYFGRLHGERYLNDEALELKERLEREYL